MDYAHKFNCLMKGRRGYVSELTDDPVLACKIRSEVIRECKLKQRDLWHKGEPNYVNFGGGEDSTVDEVVKKGGLPIKSKRKGYDMSDYYKPMMSEHDAVNNIELTELTKP